MHAPCAFLFYRAGCLPSRLGGDLQIVDRLRKLGAPVGGSRFRRTIPKVNAATRGWICRREQRRTIFLRRCSGATSSPPGGASPRRRSKILRGADGPDMGTSKVPPRRLGGPRRLSVAYDPLARSLRVLAVDLVEGVDTPPIEVGRLLAYASEKEQGEPGLRRSGLGLGVVERITQAPRQESSKAHGSSDGLFLRGLPSSRCHWLLRILVPQRPASLLCARAALDPHRVSVVTTSPAARVHVQESGLRGVAIDDAVLRARAPPRSYRPWRSAHAHLKNLGIGELREPVACRVGPVAKDVGGSSADPPRGRRSGGTLAPLTMAGPRALLDG